MSKNITKILSAINKSNYRKLISLLEKIKTPHAGTPKTKDKAFVLRIYLF